MESRRYLRIRPTTNGVASAPSSRPHRMETPQTSRLTGDPCCSLLHPKKRLPLAAPDPRGLPALEDRLDGLITNHKFCFTRRSRLKLRPKLRGYPPPKDVCRGGIDETELDRSTHDGQPR